MLQQSTTFFNTSNLPSWQNTQNALKGFGNANQMNIVYEYADAMQRGASPNTMLLRVAQMESAGIAGTNISQIVYSLKWIRMSWLVTPFMVFLPILINGWPRANSNNENFNLFKHYCNVVANYLKRLSIRSYAWYYAPLIVILQALGYSLQATHWFLGKIPPIRSRFIIRTLNLLDKYLLPLSFLLTVSAYFGLFLIGQEVLAIAAGLTLTFGILDRLNLIPMLMRNFVKKWGLQITLFANIVFGGIFEKIVGSIAIPVVYGHHFSAFSKRILVKVLGKFSATQQFANTLTDRSRSFKAFNYRVHASQFEDSLRTMNNRPREIIKTHVLDNNDLMPPPTNTKQNLNEIIQLFDNIKWEEADRRVIEQNRSHDWRLKRAQAQEPVNNTNINPEQQFQRDLNYLKSNLQTFVRRVRTKDIRSVSVGAEDLLQRYTSAIIPVLKKLQTISKDLKRPLNERHRARTTLVDTLVVLGFETGDYCGIALLRSVESAYRNLFAENKELTLKQCVRFVHQMNRETFFQQFYVKEGLNLMDQSNDSHAYSRAVALYAPRLGLPAQFAEKDEVTDFPSLVKDLLSAFSIVEKSFWDDHISIGVFKKEIKNAFNTPLLPAMVVDKWYRAFIDKHVVGTEDELEVLKDDYPPYTVENHNGVHIYKLKDEVLNLMLLDLGVIALTKTENSAENMFRALQEKTKSAESQPKINPTLNFKHKVAKPTVTPENNQRERRQQRQKMC